MIIFYYVKETALIYQPSSFTAHTALPPQGERHTLLLRP